METVMTNLGGLGKIGERGPVMAPFIRRCLAMTALGCAMSLIAAAGTVAPDLAARSSDEQVEVIVRYHSPASGTATGASCSNKLLDLPGGSLCSITAREAQR